MVIATRLEIKNCVVLPGSRLNCEIEFLNVEPEKLNKLGTLKKLFPKKLTTEQPVSKSSVYYYTSPTQKKKDPIATIELVNAQIYGFCSADSTWLKDLKTILINLDGKYNDDSEEKDVENLIVRTSQCL